VNVNHSSREYLTAPIGYYIEPSLNDLNFKFLYTLAMIDHALSAALHSLHSRDQSVDALFEFVDAALFRVVRALYIGAT